MKGFSAGLVAHPRASKCPILLLLLLLLLPSFFSLPVKGTYSCVSPVVPKGIRVWHAFALRFVRSFRVGADVWVWGFGGLWTKTKTGRVCDLTGKKANNGYKVSFSNHRTKTLQGANLQYKRLWWEEGKRFVKLRLSTKALKTVEKKGLQVMAKEAGINLADF